MITAPRRSAKVVILGLASALVLVACGGGGSKGSSDDSSGAIKLASNQSITVGNFNFTTLDAGAAGSTFTGAATPIAQDIFGLLFDAPKKDGGDFVPGIATAYKFTPDFMGLTIDLRPNLTFQDGTPFNADAIVYNIQRDQNATSPNAQYVSTITKVETVTPTQVKFTFNAPTAGFISTLVFSTAGLIGSPTAIKANEKGFGLKPVGAGAFKVDSMNPSQDLTLSKFAGYWDAANVHLTAIKYINTSQDAQVAYQNVVSKSVDTLYLSGTATAPATLQQAKADPSIGFVTGRDTSYSLLAINNITAPFDKPEARQALDYCMDRDTIASRLQGGFNSPAYNVAGSGSLYYGHGDIAGAKKAFPYPYDVAKGTALVKSLGGLKFTIQNIGGQATTISQALADQWKACGMDVTVETISGAVLRDEFGTGKFQVAYSPAGGAPDPIFFRSFWQQTTPQGTYVIRTHPEISDFLAQATKTTDTAKLDTIWQNFFDAVNKLAITIPILSAPNYYVSNKCLKGAARDKLGQNLQNAYVSTSC
jgi:peptide/nickel transport system substrate-binding protein